MVGHCTHPPLTPIPPPSLTLALPTWQRVFKEFFFKASRRRPSAYQSHPSWIGRTRRYPSAARLSSTSAYHFSGICPAIPALTVATDHMNDNIAMLTELDEMKATTDQIMNAARLQDLLPARVSTQSAGGMLEMRTMWDKEGVGEWRVCFWSTIRVLSTCIILQKGNLNTRRIEHLLVCRPLLCCRGLLLLVLELLDARGPTLRRCVLCLLRGRGSTAITAAAASALR